MSHRDSMRYTAKVRLMPPFQSSLVSSSKQLLFLFGFLFVVLGTALTVAGQSRHNQKLSSPQNRRGAETSEVHVVIAKGRSTHNQKVSSPRNSRGAETSEVRAMLAQAKSAALKIGNEYQRGLVLDEIGAAEAKAGLLDTAVATANRAEPHTLAILRAIGEELGNSNDLPKAQALGLRLKGGSSSLFGFMARRQAQKGNIEEALRTTKYIRAPEVRRYALEGIAEQQAVKGDYDEVR